MLLIVLLILFPLAVAFTMPFISKTSMRSSVVTLGVIGTCAGSVALLILNFHNDVAHFKLQGVWIDKLMLLLELAMGGFILHQAIRFRKIFVAVLVVLQVAIITFFELHYGHQIEVENNIFMDKLSLLLAMVIGIIGSLICLYAIGYMKDFHSHFHPEQKDRQKLFFFLMFVFLSAMFGIMFSNNLLWLYFFWEITTLCSFLLIGYKQTEESCNNAFRALTYNLIGGLAFAVGIFILFINTNTIELDKAMFLGKSGAVLLPAALLCFAGLTKSAQLPFSSWLLGAMVAPTPVSALLHSSTMVKAGVYLILRFTIVVAGTKVGLLLAMIGGVTFLVGSLIAISCSDAKKILAYSTITTLGLIVLCAGIGTDEAIWAAALLIMFHAVAKSLLFLCVGTIEHRIHSRNIEDMTSLIIVMPKLSIMLQIGMAGMFLAPFGMLISKWAVLKAMVDANPLLAMLVIFGGSASLFFWVKWMGKLLVVTEQKKNLDNEVHRSEWLPLTILAVLTILLCGLFPVVSSVLIEPYVIEMCGHPVLMGEGNLILMSIMLAMVMLFPLSFINYGKKVKVVDAYLGGANIDSPTQFRGATDVVYNMEMKNYYFDWLFGESRLLKCGVGISVILIVLMFVMR